MRIHSVAVLDPTEALDAAHIVVDLCVVHGDRSLMTEETDIVQLFPVNDAATVADQHDAYASFVGGQRNTDRAMNRSRTTKSL